MCSDGSVSSSGSSASRSPGAASRCPGTKSKRRCIQEVALALQGARDEAWRLKARLRLPTIIGGVMLVVAGYLGAVYGSWTGPAGSLWSHVTVTFGAVLLMLAVLPSDQWAPLVVTVLKVLLWTMLLSWYLMHLFVETVPAEGRASPFFRAFCRVYWGGSSVCDLGFVKVVMLVCLLVLNCVAVYLLMGVRRSAHVVLERLWRSMYWTFLSLAATHAVVIPIILLRDVRPRLSVGELPLACLRVLFDLVIAGIASWTTFRRRVQFCLQAQGGEVTAAAAIAAFIGGRRASEVIQEARRSCRYVSLEQVTQADMRGCDPNPALSRLSRPCRLSDVDAFLSHSWHDPPEAKWEVLQAWRSSFKAGHGREPRMWIDKYCIDQTDIQASLMCLPVFLAGCQSLLVLAGTTYLSRLWCIEELFIYLQMGRDPASIEMHLLSQDVVDRIDQFSVSDAHCHLPDDEATLLATIEAGFRDLQAFDAQMRCALRAALGAAGP